MKLPRKKQKKRFFDTTFGQIATTLVPALSNLVGPNDLPPKEVIFKLMSDLDPLSVHDDSLNAASEEYLRLVELHNADRMNARRMYSTSKDIADTAIKWILFYHLPLIALLVGINVALVIYTPPALLAVTSNVIGMVIAQLFSERNTVVNFLFGSSDDRSVKDIEGPGPDTP
jgi:hypothetical protein